MMYEVKTDFVVESTMGLIAKVFVSLKQFSHYFVGVFKIVSWNRIRSYCHIAPNFRIILHHRRLYVIIVPHSFLDLTRVHMIEDTLTIFISACKVSLVAITISCFFKKVSWGKYQFNYYLIRTVEHDAQTMTEISLPLARIDTAIIVPLDTQSVSTVS